MTEFPVPKEENIVWTCVKDNIIKESRPMRILDYVDLIINYLKKRRVGEFCEGFDGYPYFKHLIKFFPGDCFKHTPKRNEVADENNLFDKCGRTRYLVFHFSNKEL